MRFASQGRRCVAAVQLGLAVLLSLGGLSAHASGPRFVTGPPFFPDPQAVPIGWKQPLLLYSTDPGNLSVAVPHAAADALVAAAAGVWNVPVASITLAQGGKLAEHVSGANVYLDTSGMVYPPDVMSSNAAAIPIAVIYDTDGSVTDTLLGSGASAPLACNANAVTSTVDRFDPAGYILHAIVILNGRCTGAQAGQQLQMQYELQRAFGRVLGLAWSQNNDNVFTGVPTPTNNQALRWPIMHPIDILCGPYSYQCLPSPFTLRPDDIASLVSIYPIAPNAVLSAGKQTSLANANALFGTISFPNGQGMAGVNVLVKRLQLNLGLDTWDEVSAVTGMQFRRAVVSPFVAASASALASLGTVSQAFVGLYKMSYIPLDSGQTFDNLTVSTEPVNPLYTGAYGLGPYNLNAVAPSGSVPTPLTYPLVPPGYAVSLNFPIADAASVCGSGTDGTAADPAEIPGSGWWNAILCGYGHASYMGVDVKPGRTYTVETTALDVNGLATTTKAMPVIGLFAPTDQPGSLPSLGVAASAFQGLAYGTTVLAEATATSGLRLTIGVADERGDGRPDFAYQGRMFYADNVEPAQVASAGGTVTITGMGFRAGNQVLVNGVAAQVSTWSANAIVAKVPSMAAAQAVNGVALDVEVMDRGTGATSTMSGVLTYSAASMLPNAMILVSAPSGTLPVGLAASVPFAVRVVAANGVTPLAGERIVFSASAGTVAFASCGQATCTLVTDATGSASTVVTPLAAGAITLEAMDGGLLQTATFMAQDLPNSMAVLAAPTGSYPTGTSIAQPFVVRVYGPDGTTGLPNHHITFSIAGGSAVYTQCNTPVCVATTDITGAYSIFVTPTGGGLVTLQAADGPLTAQASFTAIQNVDTMVVVSSPNSTGYVGENVGAFSVQLVRSDGVGDFGELVTFTVSPNASITGCSGNPCQGYTSASGVVGGYVSANAVGTYSVKATYGSLSQTTTFTVVARSLSLHVLNAPTGTTVVGAVASSPFTVQLIGLDGVTPLPGRTIVIGGPEREVFLSACSNGTCEIATDGNGIVTTLVTPLVAGTIPLSAIYSPLTVSASVVAVAAGDLLQVVSQPGGATIYPGSQVDFRVQLLLPDGATPDAGKNVTFAVTNGALNLTGCNSGSCQVTTDAQGMAPISGVGTSSGAVTVTAAYGSLTQAMNFTVSARPNVMQLVSAPASGAYVGVAAPTPFSVRVLQSDGITAAANQNVTVSVANGAASLAACGGAAGCVLQTDSTGTLSSAVTPTAAGIISLLAAQGGVNQGASFTAVNRAEILQVITAPANGALVGDVAAVAFAVRLLQGDGATPDPGKTVVLSSGSATLASCGASSCTLTTDANGFASSMVTPLSAGSISLQALAGALQASASFTAVSRPNVLTVRSVPADGAVAGSAAAVPFAVQLTTNDGAAIAGKNVAITVTNGSLGCGGSNCVLLTDANGMATTTVTPASAGAVGLSATEETLSVSASFHAVWKPDGLALASAPLNGSLVGDVAAVPFAVQVVAGDGTAGMVRSVMVGVTNGTLSACAAGGCVLVSDANGLVTTGVVPLGAGVVNLTANLGSASVSDSFTAVAKPDVLVATAPLPASASVGDAVSLSMRALLADGVTPAYGKSVAFRLVSGAAAFAGCSGSSCVLMTDAQGYVTAMLTASAAGSVAVSVAEPAGGSNIVSLSFNALARPDSMTLVSAPSGTAQVGQVLAVPFAVRVVEGDGVTPAAGRDVAFSVTGGQASFVACGGAAMCTVQTDANGSASTAVTALSPGTVTLQASEQADVVSATFAATPRPDVLQVVSTPGVSVRVGATAASNFAVRVLLADGVTPVVGSPVSFSIAGQGAGAVQFGPGNGTPSVVATDALGLASTTVTGVMAGALTLVATTDAATGAGSASWAFQVVGNDDSLNALEALTYVAQGAVFSTKLNASALSNGSVAPGQAVVWSGAAGFAIVAAQSSTGADGLVSAEASVGPLNGGATVAATACAWTTVCATFVATAVGPEQLGISVASGGQQGVSGGVALAPVVVQVTDAAGHAVAGAAVTIGQTASALTFDCSGQGRCPAQPVLGSKVTVATTDANGLVSVAPLVLAGSATRTELAFSVGSAGFTTAVVTSRP